MTIRFNTRIVVAKRETTYGVDSSPVGSNAVFGIDFELSPMEGQDKDRGHDKGYLGANGTIPIDLHMKLKFKVELAGSGTAGTAPAWADLIRACGFAQTVNAGTSVIYNPVSDDHDSVSIYFFIGNTRFVMLGCRGNVAFRLNASDIPYLEFEFTGFFTAPSEQTRITPNYSGYKKPKEVSDATTPTFTVDGSDMVMRTFMLNAGNQVEPRFLVNDKRVIISARSELVEFQIEAVPLTTFDPYAAALNQTEVDLQLVHGTVAGNIVTIDVNAMQIQRPTGLAEAQGIAEWPLRGVPLSPSGNGNDQFTLTFT